MARRRWGGWVSARMHAACVGPGRARARSGGCTDCGTTCVQRFCEGGLVSWRRRVSRLCILRPALHTGMTILSDLGYERHRPGMTS